MIEEKSTRRIISEAILGIIVLVWSFAVINQGFYMDESGMLTIYRGIYLGNRMFVDAWGAHQLGWFMTAPFFFLYDILQPTIYPMGIGIVLFMRICNQLCRLLVAAYMYSTIRKTEYKYSAFIVAITYYMFFVDYKNFAYKSLCDFAVALFICFACRYLITKNNLYYILMAVATCMAILAYPSMFLFPVIFVLIQLVMIYRGYNLAKPVVLYCVTCFVLGGAVVLYIQLTSGLSNVIPQLQYTEDAAYKHPIYVRLGIMLLSYLFFAVVAYAPIVILKIIEHFRYMTRKIEGLVLSIYWIVFMVGILALRPDSISNSRLIYGYLIILFWYPYLIRKDHKTEGVVVGKYRLPENDYTHMPMYVFFVSVIVQLIWSITTNQGIAVPGNMSIYVVLAMLIVADREKSGLKTLRTAVVLCTLLIMGWWVPESDGGYNDILEHRTIVADGGYRGIALDDFDYAMSQSVHNLITEYVSDNDKLYIVNAFGTTGYLDTKAIQAAGSPWSRVGAGQLRVLEFWEVNPDRMPDYIIIDTANKYYENYTQGETMKYINEHYPNTVATDGNVILLSR